MAQYQPWTLSVDFAGGRSPLQPPTIPADWTALGRPRSFSMRRGKQDRLGSFAAATATVVLDNADGSLDHLLSTSVLYGSGVADPYTPVRVQATSSTGTVVTLFSGYTRDGFVPSGPAKGGGVVTAELVDWLGWAADRPYPGSLWAAWVSGLDYARRPTLWYTGDANRGFYDSSTSADTLYNRAAEWAGSGLDATMTAGTGLPVRDPSSLVPGHSGPSILLEGSVTLTTAAGLAQSGKWGVCWWVKAAANPNTVALNGTGSGGDSWAAWIDPATGYAWARVRVAGVDYTPHIAVDHYDDAAHFVTVNVVSTGGTRRVTITSDLGNDFVNIAANQASGGGVFSITDDGVTTASVYLDEVCYFLGVSFPPAAGPTHVQWVVDDAAYGAGGLGADTITTRADRHCDACFAVSPAWQFHLDDPTFTLYNAEVPSSLADALVKLGETYIGATYTLRDGTVRIRDGSYTSASADDYTDEVALITDDPAAAGPPTVVRLSQRGRTGPRLDRIANEIRVTLAGDRDLVYFDVASQARFGRRVKTYRSEAGTASDVIPYATAFVAANKDPRPELTDLTIVPFGDQETTDFVMTALELDRRVRYREATRDNATTIVDDAYRVIGESWDYGAGVESWTVKLRLERV